VSPPGWNDPPGPAAADTFKSNILSNTEPRRDPVENILVGEGRVVDMRLHRRGLGHLVRKVLG